MSFDSQQLFELLPTIYRLRDEEGLVKGSLRALVDVIAGEVAILEEDLEQLYDDQFIETCAEWVAPYIGDLIGYRTLYGLTDKIGSPRAEVANTIAYRRRKGTASMLEQLARDVTGWDARAVEFFQLLAVTQYLNHVRPRNIAWVNMRASAALATIGSPFDTAAHTAEMRRIARRRGRFNIPDVGVYLWRIKDYPLANSPAVKLVPADASDGRYLFSPTGHNAPLFNRAVAEDTITHIAEPTNVPMPITRRELWDRVETFYPSSITVSVSGKSLPASVVSACDLSDSGTGWAYAASDKALIDPVLGRLSLPPTLVVNGQSVQTGKPIVTFSYGFSADVGGGAYNRLATFSDDITPVVSLTAPATIASGLSSLTGSGVVEVHGNGRFTETLAIDAPQGARIELRGAEGSRPTVILAGDLSIDVAADAEVTLNGLLLTGAAVRIPASAGRGRVRLRHCTLVPGIALNVDGTPSQPPNPSLIVDSDQVTVEIDHCIVGGIRARETGEVAIQHSIVDATDETELAFAGTTWYGAPLRVTNTTVIGLVRTSIMRLASNTLFVAAFAAGADRKTLMAPVLAERRQEGCVRFSYLSPGARVPARFHCQPERDDALVRPQFVSTRFADPAYGQLRASDPPEIWQGADDEAEMGAFHDLFEPQREAHLRARIEEYLRFGLEAGIFYAT